MEETQVIIKKGLFSLFLLLLTVFFSFLVALIATRKLLPSDFGIYQFLLNFIGFFSILNLSLGWFSTRYIARGIDVRKETLIYSLYLNVLATASYLSIALIVSSYLFKIDNYLILLSSLLLLTNNFIITQTGIINGYDPKYTYLGNAIQSLFKLTPLIILLFILFFKLTIELIFYVLILSNLITITFLFLILKRINIYIKSKDYIKKFKNFWYIPLLSFIIGSFSFYDGVFVTIILASSLPIAFFRTAFIVSNIINYFQVFIPFYYKKMLEEEPKKFLVNGIKTLGLFSTLSLGLIFSMGDYLTGILRKEYVNSYLTACILSFAFFIGNFANIISQAILSFEKADVLEINKKYKETLFYKINKYGFISLLLQYSYLIILLLIVRDKNFEPYTISFLWAFAWLLLNSSLFYLNYKLMKKILNIKFPILDIIKYIAYILPASLFIYFYKQKEIEASFLNVLTTAIIYAGIYFIFSSLIILIFEKNIRKRVINLLKDLKTFF